MCRRRMFKFIAAIFVIASLTATTVAQNDAQPDADSDSAARYLTVPAGTKVLLVLKNAISSRNARPGDGVFLETNFPVVVNGRVAIPAGTFVQGVVYRVQRSGRIKGRAEILVHFTTLIYPNGYMVPLGGTVASNDSNDTQRVTDPEGSVQAEGTKGRDIGTVAQTTGTGAVIGGLANGGKGAAIGAGIGGAAGLVATLFTRGKEVRLESGTAVEMILDRQLELDVDRIEGTSQGYDESPRRSRRRLLPPPRRR